MSVRALTESDIPQVADLYWNYMRRREGSAPAALRELMRELLWSNPFIDGSPPSLVYAVDGRVVGFMSASLRRMSLNGEPIRVLFGGNLVVHPEFRSGLAVPRLLETFLKSDFDLSITDSANDISKKILVRMGHTLIPALNIHWSRPLQPTRYAVYTMSPRSSKSMTWAGMRLATRPFCAVADSMATRLSFSPFCQPKPRLQGADLDIPTLVWCREEFRKGYSVWPDYDERRLEWILSFMQRIPSRGMLRKIVLRDEKQKVVGWYIYYVKPGSVGEVVQVGGAPKLTKDILDHLFYDAWRQGVIALHGTVDSRRMPDFSDKGCVFTCRGGWTVVAVRKPGLLELLERGDWFFSRLDGEWALDPGE